MPVIEDTDWEPDFDEWKEQGSPRCPVCGAPTVYSQPHYCPGQGEEVTIERPDDY